MKKMTFVGTAVGLFIAVCGTAYANDMTESEIPQNFQGTWVNVADASKRAQFCQTEIEKVDYQSAKNLYVININDTQIIHDHFNAKGQVTHIVHDNLRYKTISPERIRGVSRKEYFGNENNADKSRIYKAYSFHYQLQNKTLKTPSLNNQTFYPCA